MFLAPELRDIDRDADDDRGPQPDTQRAPHQTRLARAECLRGQRGDRGDRPHAEDESDEEDQMRETDGRNGLSPRRPINARSVVIMAIWPSCVSAIGHASLIVSIMSVRHTARAGLRRRSGRNDGPGQCHGAAP